MGRQRNRGLRPQKLTMTFINRMFPDVTLEGQITVFDYIASLKREETEENRRLEKIFEDNLPLVYSRFSRISGINDNNREDILQCGRYALWKAVKAFNPELGFQFSSYAVPAIDREMQKEAQKQLKIFREDSINVPSHEAGYLLEDADNLLDRAGFVEEDRTKEVESKELVEFLYHLAGRYKKKKDKKGICAIAMKAEGFTSEKIAKALGYHKNSVTALISHGRSLLKNDKRLLSYASETNHYPGGIYQTILCLLGEEIQLEIPVRELEHAENAQDFLQEFLKDKEVSEALLLEVPIDESAYFFDEATGIGFSVDVSASKASVTSLHEMKTLFPAGCSGVETLT